MFLHLVKRFYFWLGGKAFNANISVNVVKCKQKGYATVLTLVMFSVLGLSLLAMFNSGQVVTHKLKLQNAVDAASYSTAVVVSRELNFMAYTNRAMIVNQVAIGQMVGLVSWQKMLIEATENLSDVADIVSLIPIVGQVIQGYFNAFEIAVSVSEPVIEGMSTLLVIEANAVIQALSQSQFLLHTATKGLIQSTFHDVLKDNDPDAVMSAIGNANLIAFGFQDVENFAKRTEDTNVGTSDLGRYDDFASVVKESSDDFVKGRSYEWIHPPKLLVFETWIDKKGGNEFDRKTQNGKYVWEWSAMDTVSLWTDTLKFDVKEGGFYWDLEEALPIGWGAAHTSNQSGNYLSYNSNSKWDKARENSKSAVRAVNEYGDNKVAGTSGLQRFFYLGDDSQNPTPPSFIAVAAKDSGSVRTWKEVVESNGGQVGPSLDIEEKGNLKSNKMYSIAKAEPYYSRSYDLDAFRRKDFKEEFGNLFNPYWQARLAPITPAERTQILLTLPN